MKKSWLIGVLSPCIALAGYFDSDDYEQSDGDDCYFQEEVCDHCGAILDREPQENIAARDDYDSQERQSSSFNRRRNSSSLGASPRLRHAREKAHSDRPQVVQRKSSKKQAYESNDREESYHRGKDTLRERSSSTTIGSLSKKSKPPRSSTNLQNGKKGAKAGKFKRKNTVSREEDPQSSPRRFSSSKVSKQHSSSSSERGRTKRSRAQKREQERMERRDLRGKHKNYSIH